MQNANLLLDLMDILATGYDRIRQNVILESEAYEQYKNGTTDNADPNYIAEMEILKLLERLGFPMNMQGTYFFKDLVIRIMARLKTISGPEDLASCDELFRELSNKTSNLYHELARNDLDVGIRTFHEVVARAYNAVDPTQGDAALIEEVASKMSEEGSYPECAFIVGSYARNQGIDLTSESKVIPFPTNAVRG